MQNKYFTRRSKMSNRKKVWFEDAGRKLDPGLVEQLRNSRKVTNQETNNNEIPIIVYLRKNCEQGKKTTS